MSTYSSVNTHHGNVFTAIPVVSWSGIGPDMNMMLYHNSANADSGYSIADVVGFDLGPGWSLSYSDHLRLNELPNKRTVVEANGTKNVFWWISSQQRWSPPSGVYDSLTEDIETGRWILKHKDQSYQQFSISGCDDGIGRLDQIVDAANGEGTPPFTPREVENGFHAGPRPALGLDDHLEPAEIEQVHVPVGVKVECFAARIVGSAGSLRKNLLDPAGIIAA